MRVLRSSLFVAATAILAAACGDKINLPSQNTTTTTTTTTTPKINSVLVAPSSATISAGQDLQLTAVVDADAGVTATVTWSTTSSASATVSATGLVHGVLASPGVAICATASATGVASKGNCATIVVQPASLVVPAVLQIASITTQAGGLNAPVPVPPAATGGQINVSINLTPGTEKMDSVVVMVNGRPAASQTFTAAQAAALRSAANSASADQALQSTIVLSVNTAAYNPLTGAVTFPNGPAAISVVGYGHQGGTAATNTTSQGVNLLFFNADAWVLKQTIGTSTFANNPAGYQFTTGSVAVSAIPVLYSGLTIGTASVNFGTAACDLSGAVQRTLALTAPAAGTFAWTATFPFTASAAALTAADAGTVNGYEYNSACATNAGGGEGAKIAASQYTTTNTGPTGLALGVTTPAVRLDNNAPAAPAVSLNPNGRAFNWLNDAVSFSTVNSGLTSNGMIAVAIVDGGVGGVTYAGRVGATIATAKVSANISSPASLAMTATNTTDCLALYAIDALGNTSVSPAACNTTFGVDRVAPLITYAAGSVADHALLTGAAYPAASEFIVTVSDTGLVGNSGMAPVTPVIMQISRRVASGNGVGTTTARNANNTLATTAGVLTGTGVTGASPLWSTSLVGTAGFGYYTHLATAFDAAGNSTSLATNRIVAFDNPAPTVGAASTPISVLALGWSVTALVSDNLDIQTEWFSADYPTIAAPGFAVGPSAAPLRFAQAQTAVNGFNAASFLNTNFAISQVVSLPFDIQANFAATLWPIATMEATAINVVNQVTTGATGLAPTFPAQTAIATGSFTSFNAVTNSIASNTISSGVTTAPTAANPASGTLSVTAVGPTATFNLPFSRVDFYAVNTGGAAGTEWRLIGSSAAQSLVDVGATRTFTWSIPVSGATLYTLLGFTATNTTNVIAIGYNASGTVGMLGSGLYSLTIVK